MHQEDYREDIDTVVIALQAAGIPAGDIEIREDSIQVRGADAISLEG